MQKFHQTRRKRRSNWETAKPKLDRETAMTDRPFLRVSSRLILLYICKLSKFRYVAVSRFLVTQTGRFQRSLTIFYWRQVGYSCPPYDRVKKSWHHCPQNFIEPSRPSSQIRLLKILKTKMRLWRTCNVSVTKHCRAVGLSSALVRPRRILIRNVSSAYIKTPRSISMKSVKSFPILKAEKLKNSFPTKLLHKKAI